MFTNIADFQYHGFVGKYLEGHVLEGPWFWILMIGSILLSIAVPYLLGSISTAILVSKKKFDEDIRTKGSGNAGLTNILRTYGKGAAGLTLAGDIGKGILSVLFGYCFLGYLTASIACLFCMLGHMFPCYFHFKGGKGVLTAFAGILMLDPITALLCLFVFILIVLATKFVSLGSVMAAMLFPLFLNRIATLFRNTALLGIPNLIAIIMAVLIVFMHRSNIKRLLNGTERKLSFGKNKRETLEPEDEEPEDKGAKKK